MRGIQVGFSIHIPFILFVSSILSIQSQDKIYLKTRVLLNSHEIYLSDISNYPKEKQDILIKNTPAHPIEISSTDIEILLNKEYPDIQIYGNKCLIIPLVKEFSSDELLESFKSEIIKKNNYQEDSFQIEIIEQNRVLLPKEGVEVRWGNFPRKLSSGRKIFLLDVWYDGKRIHSNRIHFLISLKHTAYIVKNPIKKHTVIKETDIETKSFFSDEKLMDLFEGNIVGLTALSNLDVGDRIRKKHVKKMYDIERGANIEIIYKEKNLVVVGKGIAKESGNLGDRIKVQSKSNGSILIGSVNEKGLVTIE
jgi:flagellar basal body P-ring formation protein FlgA